MPAAILAHAPEAPRWMVRALLRGLLRLLYRVETSGWGNYRRCGKRVLFIANHASWLDGVLLYAWLPGAPAFAINRNVVENLPCRFFLRLVRLFELDERSGQALRSVIEYLRKERRAVIFPEGRITVTGSLMKIYEGSGLVADRSKADILLVHIDGTQRSPFSYLRRPEAVRWFPKIRMRMLPPQRLQLPDALRGRARRAQATLKIGDMMRLAQYHGIRRDTLLFDAVRQAARLHGGGRVILEDPQGRSLSYRSLLVRSGALAAAIGGKIAGERYVGLMLPNVLAAPVAFLALQSLGRVVAMLNFSSGARNLLYTCKLAALKTVITSRRFVEEADLQEATKELEERVRVLYLEDIAKGVTTGQKLRALAFVLLPVTRPASRREQEPDDPAVVLFTSGSESNPKGVVLSHANLLSNYAQVMCCIDFRGQDKLFSCLPLFHSFGLNAGLLIPLLAGTRVFLYPSPLHYRRVPELVYQSNATMLFGTNTFFRAYAQRAHQYDFHRLRYAVAGAEKLQNDTLRLWMERFGIRIYQGYGVTETSPVISVNTPLASKIDTAGRLVPNMRARLVPVDGVAQGGRLLVQGPNVMLGYLTGAQNRDTGAPEYALPEAEPGPGWYDTGDIAGIDEDGFITLLGRARRFAKIGGEMISLAAVEELAARLWPDHRHATVSMPDARKGECIALLSTRPAAAGALRALRDRAREEQLGDLHVPERIHAVDTIPVLSTGKTDYVALQKLATELAGGRGVS